MDIEIRDKFNKYIESHKQLRDLFDDLNEENGIALQYFFENFAKIVLEQRQETRPHETIVIPQDDCEKQAWFIITVMRNMNKDEVEMLCKNLLARFDIDLGKLIQHVNQIKDEKLMV